VKRIYVPVAHAEAQVGLLRNLLKQEDFLARYSMVFAAKCV
jgi:hypothetical protein